MELSLTDIGAPPSPPTSAAMPEDGGIEPGPSPFRRALSSLRPQEPEPGEAGAEAAVLLLGLAHPEPWPAPPLPAAATAAPALPAALSAGNAGGAALEPALGLPGLELPAGFAESAQDPATLQPSWWRQSLPRDTAAGTARIELAVPTLSAPTHAGSLSSASPMGQFAALEAGAPVMAETVGTAEWGEALAARLSVMATQGEQQATLRLTPEELGPLEIQMNLGEERISVMFSAQHGETRSALQDSLPRLRELFVQAGLPTLDAGVSQQAPRQPRASAVSSRGAAGAEPIVADPLAGRERPLPGGRRLLDTWA